MHYTELDYPGMLLQAYPVLLTIYYKFPCILEWMLYLVGMKSWDIVRLYIQPKNHICTCWHAIKKHLVYTTK